MAKQKGMNVFLAVGLAIILFALVNLGVSAFYQQPDFNSYCNPIEQQKTYMNQSSCESMGGLWTPQVIQCIQEPCPQGYCDVYHTCNQEYSNAQEKYNSTVFYIFVALGLAISVFGFFIKKYTFQITAIAAGLALIIEGIVRNYNDKIPAFVAGFIAFIILAYFINDKFGK